MQRVHHEGKQHAQGKENEKICFFDKGEFRHEGQQQIQKGDKNNAVCECMPLTESGRKTAAPKAADHISQTKKQHDGSDARNAQMETVGKPGSHEREGPEVSELKQEVGDEREFRSGSGHQGTVSDAPKSTLSHHFKVLRESGIVHTRIEGTQRFISIRYEDLNARFPGLLPAVLLNFRQEE